MAKIMIVDDASFMRLSIRKMLEKYNYEVIGEAIDGKDAVKKYFELHPDLVTMDITMPDMTGLEALKVIKQKDPSAKVLMISAMGQEGFVREAVMEGASSFLVKPFEEERLIKAVSALVG